MPYERIGKVVYVNKNGRKEVVPGGRHASIHDAAAHLAALRHNVPEAKGSPKRRPKG